MQRIITLMSQAPALYMTTVSKEGKPHVRPFALAHSENNQLFFCTSKQGGFYQDLQHSPYVEIGVMAPDYEWIRVRGEMVSHDSQSIKQIIFDKSDIVQKSFKTVDNPNFLLFRLTNATAALLGQTHKKPEIVSFD